MKYLSLTLLLAASLCLGGCQSAYYGAMEQLGYHKRDLMVDRVRDAKASQQQAQKQFNSALEELQTLLQSDGGELQRVYDRAKQEYEASQQAADDVNQRIADVESVAEALFAEWQGEIGEMSNAALRQKSQSKLNQTKLSYNEMLKTMQRAARKMTPVLSTMKDNMLYLKHNLNASTVASISGEFSSLQRDIDALRQEMNKSIESSSKFIASMEKGD